MTATAMAAVSLVPRRETTATMTTPTSCRLGMTPETTPEPQVRPDPLEVQQLLAQWQVRGLPSL